MRFAVTRKPAALSSPEVPLLDESATIPPLRVFALKTPCLPSEASAKELPPHTQLCYGLQLPKGHPPSSPLRGTIYDRTIYAL